MGSGKKDPQTAPSAMRGTIETSVWYHQLQDLLGCFGVPLRLPPTHRGGSLATCTVNPSARDKWMEGSGELRWRSGHSGRPAWATPGDPPPPLCQQIIEVNEGGRGDE